MDSPRGRIHLVTQVLDGAELSPAAAEHFDRCLGCMACMTACPSGVQYDRLIEAARAWTDDPAHAPAVNAGTGGADIHEVAGADGPEVASGGHVTADAAGGTLRSGGARAGLLLGGTPVRRGARGREARGRDSCGRGAAPAVAGPGRTGGDLRGVPLSAAAARAGGPAADSSAHRPGPGGRAQRAAGPRLPRPRRGHEPGPEAVRVGAGRPAARAGARAWDAARGGGDAHRLRAVRLLPGGQHRDRACAGGRGLRCGDPARPGLLRRAVPALGPGRGSGRLRPAARSRRSSRRAWKRSW